ncbi:MAG: hypothetical protein A3C06_03430 [Candidatus Taylorbacteria bacterium RIFCSPHIGHO2_02_FULL_46_13]|uniref:Uncharacterized protein n=1 Tax=Candidatus Taylorbacteria bacterium RIFCSPHIGHO2_02_FULL_46_13 TaxID=1802312 RepID=A0A1G2MUB4_9BACT|nr:MAG: hypothetical protein A3C06_03430 [Candidatus Taylorbacteria bacterium RIFCSPHIGHO2_02_FULL_46_13]
MTNEQLVDDLVEKAKRTGGVTDWTRRPNLAFTELENAKKLVLARMTQLDDVEVQSNIEIIAGIQGKSIQLAQTPPKEIEGGLLPDSGFENPTCPNCGHVTKHLGACFKCLNCGERLGAS